MIVNDLLVTGSGRFVDKVYANEFEGDLVGNADTASVATELGTQPQLTSKSAMDGFLSGTGVRYATFNTSESGTGFQSNDGMILSLPWANSTAYGAQIAFDDAKVTNVAIRGKGETWGDWYRLLHTGNFTSHVTPSAIGAAASGHTHSVVNGVTPEWSGSISYANTDYVAAWTGDGTKLKALAKSSFAPASHTHNYAGSASAGGSANSAVKLDTASAGYSNSPVYFADGKPVPVTSVKQSLIGWASDNLSGTFTPIDAGIAPQLGANRLAFMPANAITVEYSRDGGNTWYEYNRDDMNSRKQLLFSGKKTSLYIGGTTDTGIDKSNYMLRITVDTVSGSVYTHLHKFALLISTEGSTGSYVTLTGRTKANYDAGTDTWTTFVDKATLSGWSGWNILNTSFTAGNSSSSHYRQFRFTFGVTSHASTVAYSGLMVYSIMGFGGVGWTTPSNMADIGTLYTYDGDQNAFFPRDVYATTFRGALSGNVTGNLTGNVIGNADTSTQIKYSSQLTSDDAINNFNAANRMQAAIWNNTSSPGVTNGIILSTGWTATSYGAQIAIDDDPTYYMALRQRNEDGWKAWKRIPMGDGTGASGTWGISISGTAAEANYLNYENGNEINFIGSSNVAGVYFNYRDGATSNNSGNTPITAYYFCNKNASQTGVRLIAESFSGNAATATKATQDASGNTITSTYATKTELNNKSKVQIVRW